MAFANLSAELQAVYLVQYGLFFKSALLLAGLIFAIFYLFYWKREQQKPTPFFSIGIVRVVTTTISWIFLFSFPLLLLLLNPEYALSSAVDAFFPVYLTLLTCAGIGLMVDLFYFAPSLLLKMGGFDLQDKRINQAYGMLKKYFKKNG